MADGLLPTKSFAAETANSSHQLHVSREHGDSLRIDGHQIGVLEQIDQIGLGRFLQRTVISFDWFD